MSSEETTDPAPRPRSRSRRRRGRNKAVDVPTLGYIPCSPDMPVPTLADPVSDAAAAFVQTLDRIQAATNAGILLMSSATPGSGATLAAINLGIAASRHQMWTF